MPTYEAADRLAEQRIRGGGRDGADVAAVAEQVGAGARAREARRFR